MSASPTTLDVAGLEPASQTCAYQSPVDGWHCSNPVSKGPGEKFCVLHDPSPRKPVLVFQEHLSRLLDRGVYWFDGVIFPCHVSFQGRKFPASVSFHGAAFLAGVDFRDAKFEGRVTLFSDCMFQGGLVDFSGAQFRGERLDFSKAVFDTQRVSFKQAHFESAATSFDDVQCLATQGVSFGGAKIGGKEFYGRRARFRSQTIGFRSAKFTADEVNLSECRLEARELSFEDLHHEKGTVDLSKSVVRAEECILRGSRWHGDSLLLTRLDWTIDLLKGQGLKFALRHGLDMHAARIQSETIDLRESASLTPKVKLDAAKITARREIHLQNIDWESELTGRGVHLEAQRIDLDGAQLSGGCLEVAMAYIGAEWMGMRGANVQSARFSLSNSTMEVDEVELAESEFASYQVLFHRLRWSGQTFDMRDLSIQSKRLSFNHAVLNGSLFRLERTDLADCKISFWETDFRGTRVSLNELYGESAKVRLGSQLGDFEIENCDSIQFDFDGSRWPGENAFKRPMLAREKEAKTAEELAACEEKYLWIAEQYERSHKKRRAGDFYYSAYECRRKRLGREGRYAERLKMELMKWGAGYRLRRHGYAPSALMAGLFTLLFATLSRWHHGSRG